MGDLPYVPVKRAIARMRLVSRHIRAERRGYPLSVSDVRP